MKSPFIPFALLAAGLLAGAGPRAEAQDYSNIRIVRLSFVEGNVQYRRPGQDWQDARLNLPIEEGFALRTADGYAEVEFEDALTLRMATNATIEFTDLALENGGRITRLTVSQGTAIVSAKLKRADAVWVASPSMELHVPRDGRFRFDVSPADSWVTVFHGKVEVDPHTGATTQLSAGHTLHVDAAGSGAPELAGNPPRDDFDKWVSHREDEVDSARSETSTVIGGNSYTEGFADLYNYGLWSDIPGYGLGWMPYGVGIGWMPFMDGQWQYMGGLGWNWMSGEPWGWLPYHFGSWVNSPGVGWAWLPVGATSWTPATASWVRLNNQLGWIPNGPPLSSKASKTQLAAVPSTVVMARTGATGAIGAGARFALSSEGMRLEAASAPPPIVAAPVRQLPGASVVAHGNATNLKSFAQSAPASFTRGGRAPAFLHGPSATTSPLRAGRLSSVPRAMMAPRSPPVPAIARSASFGGFRGGFGARSGVGTGMINGSPTSGVISGTSAPMSARSVSHSAGSAGTAGGRR